MDMSEHGFCEFADLVLIVLETLSGWGFPSSQGRPAREGSQPASQ
jgi:hypothetical protein